MGLPGGDDIGGLSGDNSTVGVSNQGGDTGEGTSIWQSWGKSWHSRGDGTDGTDSGGDWTNGTDGRGNWGWGKSRARLADVKFQFTTYQNA